MRKGKKKRTASSPKSLTHRSKAAKTYKIPTIQPQLREQLSFNFESNGINGSGFRDPAFADNKTLPVHRWVPWIAGFSSQFVQGCFDQFLKNKKGQPCVLDPFAGVGTTLVRAFLNGYKTVGFEINPYAALACRVKLSCSTIDLKALDRYIEKFRVAVTNGEAPRSQTPPEFVSRIPFFSKSVELQVLAVLDFIASIRNRDIADLFKLAFGSVMVSFSNYSYEPSLSSRPGAGKPLIENADVVKTVYKKLQEIAADIRWAKDEIKRTGKPGEGTVFPIDFLTQAAIIAKGSIDLMVTSPPYMNNYHYIRNTRPQLFWLSLVSSPKELKFLEEANFGKYWQTVRGSKPLDLQFQHDELSDILNVIRQTRSDKGVYGGSGWANYVTSYFNDTRRFLTGLKRVLKKGGTGVIVIGNSIIQGHEIKIDHVLADLAKQIGLGVEGIHCLRSKRVGASITQSAVRRGEKSTASLYESAVILRKE